MIKSSHNKGRVGDFVEHTYIMAPFSILQHFNGKAVFLLQNEFCAVDKLALMENG